MLSFILGWSHLPLLAAGEQLYEWTMPFPPIGTSAGSSSSTSGAVVGIVLMYIYRRCGLRTSGRGLTRPPRPWCPMTWEPRWAVRIHEDDDVPPEAEDPRESPPRPITTSGRRPHGGTAPCDRRRAQGGQGRRVPGGHHPGRRPRADLGRSYRLCRAAAPASARPSPTPTSSPPGPRSWPIPTTSGPSRTWS